MQHLDHFGIKFRVFALKVVSNLMWPDSVFSKDFGNGSSRNLGQRRVADFTAMTATMLRQEIGGPQFQRVAKILWFLARQRDKPGSGFRRNTFLFARPWQIVNSGKNTQL